MIVSGTTSLFLPFVVKLQGLAFFGDGTDYRKTIEHFTEKGTFGCGVRGDRGLAYTEGWATPISAMSLAQRFIIARGFMMKSSFLLVGLYSVKDAL